MTENYLSILEDSLKEKLEITAKIREYNSLQSEALQSEQVDLEKFDMCADEKSKLIERLTTLDKGFETLYRKIAGELKENRQKYGAQIKRLQELITRVTEDSMTIQAQEARNKKLVEEYFQRERSNIGQSRKSSKAAYDYYRNVNKLNAVTPQYMDSKK